MTDATKPAGKPIAITGIGMVSSLGLGKEENWRRLSAGESGIHRLTRFPVEGLRTTIGGSVDFLPISSSDSATITFEMARRAAQEAIEQSGIGEPGAFPGEMFLASPPMDIEWSQRLELARQQSAKQYAGLLDAARAGAEQIHRTAVNGGVASRLMEEFGPQGSPITLTTACASGASAIQLGIEAIRRGGCDTALAIGADGSIQAESVIRFSLLSALSTANEEPAGAAKPFARNRDGFVMAEGAAALVLEDPDKAEARGAEILGYILGCGEAADTFHRTRSNPNGAAIVRCMRAALADAELGIADVDYINAHGTGTPENDKMEAFCIQQLFGERAGQVPISSNKSMIGHTLTAAGAIEAAFSILTLINQLLPPTINYRQPDPTIPLDVVPNQARPARIRRVLSNSFGFGGQNVSLVLSAA
jgi:3-oxoacyl-[acyl-carrier-protein] synthase II